MGQGNELILASQKSLYDFLKANERHLTRVAPKLDNERLKWLLVNSIRTTPALCGVSAPSFLNAVLLASSLQIEVRRNSAYLVPYGRECQLLIDYRAKIELGQRAGITIHPPMLVRANDEFRYGFTHDGLEFRHTPKIMDPDRGEVIGGYVMAENRDGKRIVQVMSLAEIERVRARAKSGCARPFDRFNKTFPGLTLADIRRMSEEGKVDKVYSVPWVTDWDAMAEKTLIHKLCNRIPQQPDMELAQRIDEAEAIGERMPAAVPELEDFLVDPTYDVPLVDGGGDTREEQRAAQEAVKQRKLAAVDEKRVRQTIAEVAQQEQPQ